MMTSSWLEILRRALLAGEVVGLSEGLLPERGDPNPWELIKEATSSFAVSGEAVLAIMVALGRTLVVRDRPVPLPSDIVLLRTGDRQIVAGSSKQIGLKNALDIVAVADQMEQDSQKTQRAAYVEKSARREL
jgi:hypothetical protein